MQVKTPAQVLLAGLFASTAVSVQFINAVWTTSSFTTISGPSGNENGVGDGFSLVDNDGNVIWSESSPNDYAPCHGGGDGYAFTVTDGCFGGNGFQFRCAAEFDGTPSKCAALDLNGDVLAQADGGHELTNIGIAAGEDGYCAVTFALGENMNCLPDSKDFTVS